MDDAERPCKPAFSGTGITILARNQGPYQNFALATVEEEIRFLLSTPMISPIFSNILGMYCCPLADDCAVSLFSLRHYCALCVMLR